MNDDAELIKSCARVLLGTVSDLIYADPHSWSTRGCSTCRAITSILGEPFGCDRMRADKAATTPEGEVAGEPDD